MRIFFIILFTISLLNGSVTFSQEYNPNKLGFFFGPTLSNVKIDFDNTTTENNPENKNKVGFVAGASIDLFTSERFTLYSELYFNRKNGESRQTGTSIGANSKIESTIDYLSYDVSGRLDLAGKTVVPFLFAGPRIDFYLTDKLTTDFSGSFVNEISEKITRVGVGASAGAGLEFYTGSKFSLQISIQYSPSFYDIFKEDYVDAHSNSIELKVGTRF